MIPIVSGQTRTCGGIMHKEPNTPSSREREDFIIEDLDLGCEEVIPASGPGRKPRRQTGLFPTLLPWLLLVVILAGTGLILAHFLLPAKDGEASPPASAQAGEQVPDTAALPQLSSQPTPGAEDENLPSAGDGSASLPVSEDAGTEPSTDAAAQIASAEGAPAEGEASPGSSAPAGESGASDDSAPADGSGTSDGSSPAGGSGETGTVSGNDDGGSVSDGDGDASSRQPEGGTDDADQTPPMNTVSPLAGQLFEGYAPYTTEHTAEITNEEVISEYAVLIDLDTGEILAQRNATAKMYPASMTKVLTVLVAAEHVTSLTDTFTITRDITNYVFSNDCSAVCWDVGEKVPVSDLFYGAVLPSGADAVLGLAATTAGDTETFVGRMNDKVSALGLTASHFDNPIGLFSEETYTTPVEMAMIMKAAVENGIAYDALHKHIHTTLPTAEHPDGLTLSNLFLRRIEDHFDLGEVLCAKTGFVNQSGNCAVSVTVSNTGRHYVCVTGKSSSAWKCIYDHVRIYNEFVQ